MPSRGGELDLSGAWSGLFSYPRANPPVPFEATLVESGAWLSGVAHEIGRGDVASGLTLSSTLQGRRTGRSVTFLKTYDGAWRGYDAVHYAGEVNEDGTEIEGLWTIPGMWSGSFLMIRSGGEDAGAVIEEAAQV